MGVVATGVAPSHGCMATPSVNHFLKVLRNPYQLKKKKKKAMYEMKQKMHTLQL